MLLLFRRNLLQNGDGVRRVPVFGKIVVLECWFIESNGLILRGNIKQWNSNEKKDKYFHLDDGSVAVAHIDDHA